MYSRPEMVLAKLERRSDMSDELALPQDAAAFDRLTDNNLGFIKRIALMQGLSKPVQKRKDWKGRGNPPSPGDLILGFGDNAVNLGSEVLVVPDVYRPHALIIQSNAVEDESFDVNDPVFKRIEREAAKSKKVPDRAVLVGVDVLFYLPTEKEFAVFFFAKTNRANAKPCLQLRGSLSVMTSYMEETKKYSWFKTRIEASTKEEKFPSPDPTAYGAALAAFKAGEGGGVDEEDSDEADLSQVGNRPR